MTQAEAHLIATHVEPPRRGFDEPEPQAPDNSIYLRIGGQAFRCRRGVSVSWQMMQFGDAQRRSARAIAPHRDNDNCEGCKAADAEKSKAGMDMMSAMRSIVMRLLDPSERDRFEGFMDTADIESGELEEAIGKAIADVSGGKD